MVDTLLELVLGAGDGVALLLLLLVPLAAAGALYKWPQQAITPSLLMPQV